LTEYFIKKIGYLEIDEKILMSVIVNAISEGAYYQGCFMG
jgi:hypothetical protein